MFDKLPILVDAILDNNVKQTILNFALANQKDINLFNPNGEGRQFCKLHEFQNLFDFNIDEMRIKAFNSINLYNIKKEPTFGVFLGVNNEGASVHEHKDGAPEGFIHTRINFLLSKPFGGGMPVIDQIEYTIEEGQSWINLANLWNHSSTVVVGNKDRVVLSIGSFVDESELKEMFPVLFKT
jgi:hypothetical protein